MSWYLLAQKSKEIKLKSGMICKRSSIHGWGIFAPKDYSKGEKVYIVIKPHGGSSRRTEACRLTNHSKDPNMNLERIKDTVYAVASRKVIEGEECTVDYKTVIPLLAEGTPIEAGDVIAETPEAEEIVAEKDDSSLIDELIEIEKGRFS
jgi:SET domain-containing protein